MLIIRLLLLILCSSAINVSANTIQTITDRTDLNRHELIPYHPDSIAQFEQYSREIDNGAATENIFFRAEQSNFNVEPSKAEPFTAEPSKVKQSEVEQSEVEQSEIEESEVDRLIDDLYANARELHMAAAERLWQRAAISSRLRRLVIKALLRVARANQARDNEKSQRLWRQSSSLLRALHAAELEELIVESREQNSLKSLNKSKISGRSLRLLSAGLCGNLVNILVNIAVKTGRLCWSGKTMLR